MACPFEFLKNKANIEGLERLNRESRDFPTEQYLELILPRDSFDNIFNLLIHQNFSLGTSNSVSIVSLESIFRGYTQSINAQAISIINRNYDIHDQKNLYIKNVIIQNINIGITIIYRMHLICLYLLHGNTVHLDQFNIAEYSKIAQNGYKFVNELAVSSGEAEIAGKLEHYLGLLPDNMEAQYDRFYLNNGKIEFKPPIEDTPRIPTRFPYYYGCPAFYTKHITFFYKKIELILNHLLSSNNL